VRPLRRRAARMARPARVRMRSRNPCVFARRRLFGWNVRLLTRDSTLVYGAVSRGPARAIRTADQIQRHQPPSDAYAVAQACDRGRRQAPNGTVAAPGGSNERARPGDRADPPNHLHGCARGGTTETLPCHPRLHSPTPRRPAGKALGPHWSSRGPGQQAMVLSCWLFGAERHAAHHAQLTTPGIFQGGHSHASEVTTVTGGWRQSVTANSTVVHSMWTTVWTDGSTGREVGR
jgi:hypothetical protein